MKINRGPERFLLEIILGKELPIAFMFVEAGLYLVVMVIVGPVVMAKMGFGIYVSMVPGMMFGAFGFVFYLSVYRAHM